MPTPPDNCSCISSAGRELEDIDEPDDNNLFDDVDDEPEIWVQRIPWIPYRVLAESASSSREPTSVSG